jgi:predicted  nucleic acid-binding Zn-ribbon protein
MSPSEYRELVEFLGARFEAMDRRFDQIEARLVKVEVGVEENRDLIKLNAEAILGVQQQLDRFRREVAVRLDRVEHRVARLEVA